MFQSRAMRNIIDSVDNGLLAADPPVLPYASLPELVKESPCRAVCAPNNVNRETLSKCKASNLVTRKGERGDVNSATESEIETRTIESQDEREASEREQVHSMWTIECEWASNV